MGTKAKPTITGQNDTKAVTAAPAPVTSARDEEEQESEETVKTGIFSFSDGSKYEGEYCVDDGKAFRQGKGLLRTGVESYEGEWLRDQMHGRGIYCFATGAVYDGEFQANTFHGVGNYRWPDGAIYTGKWHFNRMHGDGLYVTADGVEWRGRFVNGKYDNGHVFHTLR